MAHEPINYGNLEHAKRYYERLGYQYIDVPWLVSKEALDVTRPIDSRLFSAPNGLYLVASGEQSFIQLMMDKTLTEGCYQTITPCFRDEPYRNDYTQIWFEKLELIQINPDLNKIDDAIWIVLKHAKAVLKWLGVETQVVEVGKHAWDLNSIQDNIELGSYGFRKHQDFSWIYGTGVAEPRFSTVFFREISNPNKNS